MHLNVGFLYSARQNMPQLCTNETINRSILLNLECNILDQKTTFFLFQKIHKYELRNVGLGD